MGRLTRTDDSEGNTVSYTYDEAGNVPGITYPDGGVISYKYDKNNNLISVKDATGKETRYSYDVNREYTQVLMERDGSGALSTAYVYGNERLSIRSTKKESGYYLYDGRGSVTGIVSIMGERLESYSYDPSGQAMRATSTNRYQKTSGKSLCEAAKDPGLNMVFAALAEVGVSEVGTTNNVVYNEWYYGRKAEDGDRVIVINGEETLSSYAWCSVFVCWIANKIGIADDEIMPSKSTAVKEWLEGVKNLRQWFIDHGRYKGSEEGYIPKAGDIFFKKGTNGQRHTGIVVAYDQESERIYTIDGNSGDMVQFQTYAIEQINEGFGVMNGKFSLPLPDNSC